MQMGLVILQRFSTSFLRGLHWKHLLVSRRIGDMLVAAAVNIYAAARVGVLKRFFWVTFVVLHDKDFKQLQCSSRTCNSWQSKNDGSAFEQPLQIPVCKLIFCFQKCYVNWCKRSFQVVFVFFRCFFWAPLGSWRSFVLRGFDCCLFTMNMILVLFLELFAVVYRNVIPTHFVSLSLRQLLAKTSPSLYTTADMYPPWLRFFLTTKPTQPKMKYLQLLSPTMSDCRGGLTTSIKLGPRQQEVCFVHASISSTHISKPQPHPVSALVISWHCIFPFPSLFCLRKWYYWRRLVRKQNLYMLGLYLGSRRQLLVCYDYCSQHSVEIDCDCILWIPNVNSVQPSLHHLLYESFVLLHFQYISEYAVGASKNISLYLV